MTDLTQWPVLAAVLLVLGIVVYLQRRHAASVNEQVAATLKTARDLAAVPAQLPPGATADGSAGWGQRPAMACSPDCRQDVLAAIHALRAEVAKLADEMRVGFKERDDTLGRHRVRLALLEHATATNAGDADSNRPRRKMP